MLHNFWVLSLPHCSMYCFMSSPEWYLGVAINNKSLAMHSTKCGLGPLWVLHATENTHTARDIEGIHMHMKHQEGSVTPAATFLCFLDSYLQCNNNKFSIMYSPREPYCLNPAWTLCLWLDKTLDLSFGIVSLITMILRIWDWKISVLIFWADGLTCLYICIYFFKKYIFLRISTPPGTLPPN